MLNYIIYTYLTKCVSTNKVADSKVHSLMSEIRAAHSWVSVVKTIGL